MLLRTFGGSFGVTAVGLFLAFLYGGTTGLAVAAILTVLEISVSFDNAVVNATVLGEMSVFWQKIFLTVGVLIAVFGMRLAFPLIIVGITAHLSPTEAVHLALEKGSVHVPGTYANLLHEAHPAIAAFGGMFLLMLFLDFIFEERELTWLTWLERPLARIGKLDQLSVVVSSVLLIIAATQLAPHGKDVSVLMSGVLGMVTYILVNGLGGLLEEHEVAVGPVGGGGPAQGQRSTGAQGRQGCLRVVPLPRSPGRLVQLRRCDRRLRHHLGPDHHRHRPRDRRHVHPVADGVPGPQGHPGRVRVPGARSALGDRVAGSAVAADHQVRDPRGRHRPDRRRLHRSGPAVLRPP
jgi:hypothetical protein